MQACESVYCGAVCAWNYFVCSSSYLLPRFLGEKYGEEQAKNLMLLGPCNDGFGSRWSMPWHVFHLR